MIKIICFFFGHTYKPFHKWGGITGITNRKCLKCGKWEVN